MSIYELRKAVISDDELSFSHNGRNYLLYGWNQCDGYFLSLECEGELVWQSAPIMQYNIIITGKELFHDEKDMLLFLA